MDEEASLEKEEAMPLEEEEATPWMRRRRRLGKQPHLRRRTPCHGRHRGGLLLCGIPVPKSSGKLTPHRQLIKNLSDTGTSVLARTEIPLGLEQLGALREKGPSWGLRIKEKVGV
nr:hypothetical protein Iba_chr13dCG3720 [Ipomoea batatas]